MFAKIPGIPTKVELQKTQRKVARSNHMLVNSDVMKKEEIGVSMMMLEMEIMMERSGKGWFHL